MKKDWIKKLPPGQYYIKEIIEMTGLSENSRAPIKKRLIKYGAKVKPEPIPGTNKLRDVIIWKGFKELKASKANNKKACLLKERNKK